MFGVETGKLQDVGQDEHEADAGEQPLNQVEVETGQTAHFDGFEDSGSSVVPDHVEEDDVVDEQKDAVHKSCGSNR